VLESGVFCNQVAVGKLNANRLCGFFSERWLSEYFLYFTPIEVL
jgi:hypothetical protein